MYKIFHIRYNLLLILFTLTGCRHQPEAQFYYSKPVVYLMKTDSTVFSDTLLDAGIYFKILVRGSSDSLLKLTEISISKSTSNLPEFDSLVHSNVFEKCFTFKTNQKNAIEKWMIFITDSKGINSSCEFYLSTVVMPLYVAWIKQPGFVSSDTQIRQGEAFYIGITASSMGLNIAPKLKYLQVSRSYRNITEIITDSAINGNWLYYSHRFNSPFQDRTDRFTFSVTDNRDSVKKLTCYVYTFFNDTLQDEFTGKIWNYIGDSSNAWDLVNNVSLLPGQSNVDKDMINSTVEPAEPPYFFEPGWFAETTTRFVKPLHFDYEHATRSAAVDAFTGSTINTGLSYTWAVDSNDIYVAKLRGSQNYAVIRIIRVKTTTSDNLDFIEFKYKK